MSAHCIITASGTGGHLFPAQEVATFLQAHKIAVTFMAHGLTNSPYFSKELFSYYDIHAASLSKNPLKLLKNLYRLASGTMQSIQILRKMAPHCIIGFGSYHTVPVLLAANYLSIPIILHEANAYPGKVNRLFSKVSQLTGVCFEEAKRYLHGSTKLVSLPLRESFTKKGLLKKEEAIASYGLDKHKKTLLFFGGSQGAKQMNELMLQVVQLLPKNLMQVIHLTGKSDPKPIERSYQHAGFTSYVAPFENDMPRAYAAADLAICRGGASSIAELMHCHVPSIIIPFPFAADNHQLHNARFLEEIVQGCRVYEEKELTPQRLAHEILTLMEDAALHKMRKNIGLYLDTHKAEDFGTAILEMVRKL